MQFPLNIVGKHCDKGLFGGYSRFHGNHFSFFYRSCIVGLVGRFHEVIYKERETKGFETKSSMKELKHN